MFSQSLAAPNPPPVTRSQMQWGMSRAPKRYTAIPCLVVHFCTFLYYVSAHLGQCAVTTIAGQVLHPLHTAMWTCSVSCQTLTLYGLEQGLAPLEPEETRKATSRLAIALLAIQGMMWTGALGEVYQGALAVNYAYIAASFTCFAVLLHYGVWAPLNASSKHVYKVEDAKRVPRSLPAAPLPAAASTIHPRLDAPDPTSAATLGALTVRRRRAQVSPRLRLPLHTHPTRARRPPSPSLDRLDPSLDRRHRAWRLASLASWSS